MARLQKLSLQRLRAGITGVSNPPIRRTIPFYTNMYYVYILISQKDNKLYTGKTEDLRRRFTEHTEGQVESTKDRRPLTLLYYEAYTNEDDASAREIFLKSGRGREVLKKQLKNTLGP